MIQKIKIFKSYQLQDLEDNINKWLVENLSNHPDAFISLDMIKMNEAGDWTEYLCYITYKIDN